MPSSRVISQAAPASSNTADVTRLLSWMSRRRSNVSATWFRYRSVSGWDAKCSVQSHRSSSSWLNEYP